jgi:hypothetical protein
MMWQHAPNTCSATRAEAGVAEPQCRILISDATGGSVPS